MYKNNMQAKPFIMEDGFSNLANAIILQAVKDYRIALKVLVTHPNSISANKEIFDAERFFHSKWFSDITSIDGNMLMKKLREEVKIHE